MSTAPAANPQQDAVVTSASNQYKSLMDEAIKENAQLLAKELEDKHQEAKTATLQFYKNQLATQNLTEDVNFSKKLTDGLENQYASYKSSNDGLLQTAIDTIESVYYKARSKYDPVREKVETYKNTNDLLVDHQSFKALVLKYFSDNKADNFAKFYSEYEKKLGKEVEDFFTIYKNLVELKQSHKMSQDEAKVSSICTETLNFYKNTMEEILKTKPVMSEDQLKNESKKVLVDAKSMFQREVRQGNFNNGITDKYLIHLETNAQNMKYEEDNKGKRIIGEIKAEKESLAVLLDCQDFYVQLMDNAMNSRISVFNKERLKPDHERFKGLVQSKFSRNRTSGISAQVAQKHEEKLEQFLSKMYKLMENSLSKRT